MTTSLYAFRIELFMRLLLILIILFFFIACKKGENRNTLNTISLEEQHVNCIEDIFEKDSVLGEIRNHAPKAMALSEAINSYTHDLESLDFSNCPENFTASFKKHIEAWKMVTKVSDKYPALRGELHDIFEALETGSDSTEFKLLLKEVWDTWNVVKESSQ